MRVLIIAVLAVAAGVAKADMPDGFVRLRQVDPGIVQDIRYAGADNFLGRPVAGYKAPECLLLEPAAKALAVVQATLKAQGLGLVVFDCYRPQKAVDDFVSWSQDHADTRTKAAYYPGLAKPDLFAQGYIATRSGHSRGFTVDVGLLQDGKPLDMGTPFDFFGEASHTDNPSVGAEVLHRRHVLRDAMVKAGFKNLPIEWWHFTLAGDDPAQPHHDFDVD